MENTFFTETANLDLEYIYYQNANIDNKIIENLLDNIDKINQNIIHGDRLPKRINSEIAYYYTLVDKYIVIYRENKDKKLIVRILNLSEDFKYIEYLLTQDLK